MPRHPTAPRAHVLALALPRPAGSAWHEWAATLAALTLLLAALLSR